LVVWSFYDQITGFGVYIISLFFFFVYYVVPWTAGTMPTRTHSLIFVRMWDVVGGFIGPTPPF
jgi:hypothetical protein